MFNAAQAYANPSDAFVSFNSNYRRCRCTRQVKLWVLQERRDLDGEFLLHFCCLVEHSSGGSSFSLGSRVFVADEIVTVGLQGSGNKWLEVQTTRRDSQRFLAAATHRRVRGGFRYVDNR